MAKERHTNVLHCSTFMLLRQITPTQTWGTPNKFIVGIVFLKFAAKRWLLKFCDLGEIVTVGVSNQDLRSSVCERKGGSW